MLAKVSTRQEKNENRSLQANNQANVRWKPGELDPMFRTNSRDPKTRPIEVRGGKIEGMERKVREKMGLEKGTEVYDE